MCFRMLYPGPFVCILRRNYTNGFLTLWNSSWRSQVWQVCKQIAFVSGARRLRRPIMEYSTFHLYVASANLVNSLLTKSYYSLTVYQQPMWKAVGSLKLELIIGKGVRIVKFYVATIATWLTVQVTAARLHWLIQRELNAPEVQPQNAALASLLYGIQRGHIGLQTTLGGGCKSISLLSFWTLALAQRPALPMLEACFSFAFSPFLLQEEITPHKWESSLCVLAHQTKQCSRFHYRFTCMECNTSNTPSQRKKKSTHKCI